MALESEADRIAGQVSEAAVEPLGPSGFGALPYHAAMPNPVGPSELVEPSRGASDNG